ncbi:MAG: hypothetical protein NDJ90_09245 [Oligoflexia bacterium]|nr:hypothetical protein [Oligoflexia bacterium]
MANTQTENTQTTPAAKVAPGTKKRARRAGKKKLVAKLRTDREFAKTYFGTKSKRSTDKKAAFRKKKNKKK